MRAFAMTTLIGLSLLFGEAGHSLGPSSALAQQADDETKALPDHQRAAVVAYQGAKTTVALAQRSLARQRQRFERGLISREDIDAAEKAVADAQLTVEVYERLFPDLR
jgi:multidrug resistance efflux pump